MAQRYEQKPIVANYKCDFCILFPITNNIITKKAIINHEKK